MWRWVAGGSGGGSGSGSGSFNQLGPAGAAESSWVARGAARSRHTQPVTGLSTGHPRLTSLANPALCFHSPPRTCRRHFSANRCLVSQRPRDSSDLTQSHLASPPSSPRRTAAHLSTNHARLLPATPLPVWSSARARRFTAASHFWTLWPARNGPSLDSRLAQCVWPSHCSGQPDRRRWIPASRTLRIVSFLLPFVSPRAREPLPRPLASLLSYQTTGDGATSAYIVPTMECIRYLYKGPWVKDPAKQASSPGAGRTRRLTTTASRFDSA